MWRAAGWCGGVVGNVRSNIGKWFTYVKGRLGSGPGDTQNLNDDLQATLADELDAIHNDLFGTAVSGLLSWQVVPTVNPLEVKVTPGVGYFLGQRGITVADVVIVPQLANSTNGIQIYAELDDTQPAFDPDDSTWAVRMGWLGPLSAIPQNAILLATINTPASGAVPTGNIADQRKIVARDFDIVSSINDNVALSDVALNLQQRINMILTRLRTIIGGTTWRDGLPNSGGATITWLAQRFNTGPNGHRHTGNANDAPRLAAGDVICAATPGSSDTAPVSGSTATDVQNAIVQLAARKFDRNGILPMTGPLILAGDPQQDLEAATMRFVLARVSTLKVTSTGIRSLNTLSTSEQSLTINMVSGSSPSPISLSATGRTIEFKSNVKAQWRISVSANPSGAPNWSVIYTGRIRFRIYRDGVPFDEAAHPLDFFVALDPGSVIGNTWVFDVPVPVFFDGAPGGTTLQPQPRTYDLRAIMTNESLIVSPGVDVVIQKPTFGAVNQSTPAFCGRWFAVEG